MRINKYLSQHGVCSKRAADRLILAGQVTVNGLAAEVGQRVDSQDEVWVKGQPINAKPKPIYLLYHKPVGVVCTHDRTVKANLVDALDYPQRVFAVGRLDKDSEGLLLLTNDGAIFNPILRAEHQHEKEYVVTVDHSITPEFLSTMASGVAILNTTTLPCLVTQLSDRVFNIVLTQGLNLQIRRMCQTLGYRVQKLQRIRIMHLKLGYLEANQYRELSADEQADLGRRSKTCLD
ncbi:RNA pseudouridine synthase [Thiomicrospira sp. R3]|uniref:pseudouridine synthase n=1 Tax=Thiomicrospira sp. R3 TaxID=3035472 RepID=UPI00259BE2CB|nr:RNA pseudouridine synthase [Thiomicrospira sp. R3]WFE69194.1 RNA pseudouridine synthase [Thiomicrospira sp. R3]